MIIRKITFIIVIALFGYSYLFSNNDSLIFSQYTNLDGLSHITVSAIFQDSRGNLWLGTYNGLNKYDGYNFTVYQKDEKDKKSLSHNMISSIAEDSLGNLWISTMHGLNRYNYKTDDFTRYYEETDDSTSLSDSRTAVVYVDKKGQLWVGTYRGLSMYQPETDSFIRYLHNPGDSTSLSADIVACIHHDSQDRYLVGTFGGGFCILNPETGKFRKVKSNSNALGSSVKAIYEQERNNYWIAHWDAGLVKFNSETNEITSYDAVEDNTITALYPYNDLLYVGTWNKGLYAINLKTGSLSNFEYSADNENSVSHNRVISIAIDQSEILWAGTRKGLNKIQSIQYNFTNISEEPSSPIPISNNDIGYLFEDEDQELWIGISNGDINRYNPENGSFKNYTLPGNTKSDRTHFASCMLKSNKPGQVLLCTNQGLYSFTKESESFNKIVFPHASPEFKSADFNRGVTDRYDYTWITTSEGDLIRLDEKQNMIEAHNLFDNLSIEKENFEVHSIINDREGYLWIAARYLGLFRFDPSTGNTSHFSTENSNLLSSDILYIYEDSKSQLWVGTIRGLELYEKKTNTFRHFSIETNKQAVSIRGILEDYEGYLWLSTGKGIVRFHYKTASYKFFNKHDGITNIKFNSGACIKTSKGKMFFGGIDGVTCFHPDQIKINEKVPPVVLTRLELFNTPVTINEEFGGRRLLTQHISQTKKIELSYKQNYLTFEFSALDFEAPVRNQYAYMLEEFDTDWIYSENKRTATYTSLDPGTYKFKVKASNPDGKWNETGTSIEITILSPFWQTIWFRLAVLLFLAGMLILIFRLRLNNLKRQRTLLEIKVSERTEELVASNENLKRYQEEIEIQNKELEMHQKHLANLVDERTSELTDAKNRAEKADRLKTSFLANMSHEIRTPMNAILGFLQLLDDPDITDENKNKYKNIIESNGHSLLHLIDDIIHISQIESGILSIINSTVNVNGIFDELYIKYKNQLAEKGLPVRLNYHKEQEELFITTDELRFRQIIDNLIGNAIKFTQEGTISFTYTINDGKVIFKVEDTGIGIKPENLRDIFTPFTKVEDDEELIFRGAGLGLSICNRLIQLLGGEIWVESTINSGSAFYFSLPNLLEKETPEKNLKVEPGKKHPVLNGKKILVVEDEEENLIYIQTLLKQTNALVVPAHNGQEAINEITKTATFDLVLMDLKMPVMDGITATKKIREMNYNMPIVAVTAFIQTEAREKCLESGCTDFVLKPVLRDKLYAILREHIT